MLHTMIVHNTFVLCTNYIYVRIFGEKFFKIH